MRATLEQSTFQKRPAYRYIRETDKLPSTDEARREDDPIARIKLFDPTSSWTWYISGYDPETRIAYGLVNGFALEWGEIYMPELVDHRARFGLPIERDLNWTPKPFSEVK